jgi:hypothetical protein
LATAITADSSSSEVEPFSSYTAAILHRKTPKL